MIVKNETNIYCCVHEQKYQYNNIDEMLVISLTNNVDSHCLHLHMI